MTRLLGVFLAALLFLPSPRAISRILFVGNSITYHETNIEKYNWPGAWGMAASSADRDYVHQVWAGVAAQQGNVPDMRIVSAIQVADIQAVEDDIAEYEPDLIVVQWGEAAPLDMPQEDWDAIYRKIADASGTAKVLAVGMWGTHPIGDREEKLRIAALNARMVYIPFSDLHAARTAEMCAGLHPGVCNHPNDGEMAAIAERVLAAIYGQEVYLPTMFGGGGETIPPPQ